MARIKRYYTALRRYNRSKGFGIHSPFAFSFVLRVLRERLPYYAYDDIDYRRHRAMELAAKVARHPRIISFKNAKMLFRITNYFNPMVIMQIGTSYGVSTTAMLDVDSRANLVLYPAGNPHAEIYDNIVREHASRIIHCERIADAVERYYQLRADQRPFVLVNSMTEADIPAVDALLTDTIEREGVVILRNLSQLQLMRDLWERLNAYMGYGMSFTNGKLAVVVAYRHLPRQNFSLWF